jgi:hypothetical protein
MASVSKFRLVSALHTGSPSRFEPTIGTEGRVEYKNASEFLDQYSGTDTEALDSLADRNLIDKEYTTKVYVCPSCRSEGMQFITACPHCDSTHSVSTSFFEHERCGYTDQTTAFETGEETYRCPGCETETDPSELTMAEYNHLCMDCDEPFATPEHRLWCRKCSYVCPPHDTAERTLYEYTLSEEGEQWYTIQTDARDILADGLESRGFDVRIETEATGPGDETYLVHLYARDELLDQGLIVDIHSAIDLEKLTHIAAAAQQTGARPALLTTAAQISDETLHSADQHGVMVLMIETDGSLKRPRPMDADRHADSNIVDRLTSAVDFGSWRKTR